MKTGEDLTVLVFKDNSTARTFRVPTRWISKLGTLAGIVGAIAILGLVLSTKYYIAMRQALRTSSPAYTQDLEQEIASLRAVKSQTQAAAPIVNSVATNSGATPAPTVTVTATPAAVAGAGSPLAFSALPANLQGPPAASDIPVTIFEPRVSWVGRTLKVQFFVQYAREDKGSQQGRIVLLARGADTLLAYPAGVLNLTDGPSLIAPGKGEYFSVSRIREVKADFGPMKSNTTLKEVEVFLFNNENRLLIHQVLTPTVRAEEPRRAVKQEDADTTEEKPVQAAPAVQPTAAATQAAPVAAPPASNAAPAVTPAAPAAEPPKESE